MTQTTTEVTVKIMGKPAYQAQSVSAAITALPDTHLFTLIFLDGAYDAKGVPETQLVSQKPTRYGIRATRDLHVGDAVEVIHRGATQNSGGGRYCLVTRKTMRVEKLTGVATVTGGDAEDGQDFVRAGTALFAILGEI